MIAGRNPGVVAVISFFVMSGYVMALLVTKHYPRLMDAPAFYLDRAARLFPQYLFYLGIVVAMALTIGGIKGRFVQIVDLQHIILNALILPTGYFMYDGLDRALYIAPAWSLGLEMSFYLVFPFFWVLPKAAKIIVTAISAGVGVCAFLGVLQTDYFGYRLLPGTLYLFAAGCALAFPNRIGKYYPLLVATGASIALVVALVSPTYYSYGYNLEVTLGTLIGVTAVWLLSKLKFSSLDEFLGNMSYGVFLSHYPLIYVSNRFNIDVWMFVPLGSVVLSFLSYKLVEQPALKLRKRIRERRTVSSFKMETAE